MENASTAGRDGKMGVDNGERNAVSINDRFLLLFYRPILLSVSPPHFELVLEADFHSTPACQENSCVPSEGTSCAVLGEYAETDTIFNNVTKVVPSTVSQVRAVSKTKKIETDAVNDAFMINDKSTSVVC